MNPSNRYRRQPYLSWKEESGEILVIDQHEGCVYRFNSVAAVIWKLLDGELSVDAVIDRLSSLFTESPDKIRKDALKFIHTLHDMDLIQ